MHFSCLISFLQHLHFFSIPDSSHNVTKSNIIHIDPFFGDTEVVPPIVSHSPTLILDHDYCMINTSSSIYTGTLLSSAPIGSLYSMAFQVPSKTMAPSQYPQYSSKSF